MPETIDRKGQVLAMMGAYTFERLEKAGVETHYIGMEKKGKVKRLEKLKEPSSRMYIELVNVLEPEFVDGNYDYSIFSNPPVNNFLIPLEIIFRNRIPIGSSARRRYSPKDLGLDMEKWSDDPVSLDKPIIESSTKLEEQDRYIDDGEADRIVGVDLSKVYEKAGKANRIISERAEASGMRHDDGKVEFLYIDGDIVVGDVAGTFDEDRFTFNGQQVSKEVLRQAYKKEQPEWVEEVKNAKERAKKEGIENWKSLVDTGPEKLGIEELVSEMYQAGANRYIGREFFDVRDLKNVMRDIQERF